MIAVIPPPHLPPRWSRTPQETQQQSPGHTAARPASQTRAAIVSRRRPHRRVTRARVPWCPRRLAELPAHTALGSAAHPHSPARGSRQQRTDGRGRPRSRAVWLLPARRAGGGPSRVSCAGAAVQPRARGRSGGRSRSDRCPGPGADAGGARCSRKSTDLGWRRPRNPNRNRAEITGSSCRRIATERPFIARPCVMSGVAIRRVEGRTFLF